MKTKITKERSKLMVRKGYRDVEEFVFYNSTLKDWYPLNVNYEYKFSMDRKDIYLTLSDTYATYYDYGVETKNRAKQPGNRFNPTERWYNPLVKQDNLKISSLACELGVVNFYTADKDITWESIERSYETLLKRYEEIKFDMLCRAIEYVDFIELRHAPEEKYDKYLYKYAKKSELDELNQLSKMYVMVGMLKKIKEAEG